MLVKTIGELGNSIFDLLGVVVGITTNSDNFSSWVEIVADESSLQKIQNKLENYTVLSMNGQIESPYLKIFSVDV